jgi:cell division protein FtsI/penicillin-binding protein 2
MPIKRTPHKSENPHHRVAFVGLVFLVWMGLIAWRLVNLAVVRHEEFAARAASQRETSSVTRAVAT